MKIALCKFLAVPMLFMGVYALAYTYKFENRFDRPVRFFVDYGSFLCDNDDISLAPNTSNSINTKACCWHKVTIECEGKKVFFYPRDAFAGLQAIEFPTCRNHIFWVNQDGYYGITSSESGQKILGKLFNVRK